MSLTKINVYIFLNYYLHLGSSTFTVSTSVSTLVLLPKMSALVLKTLRLSLSNNLISKSLSLNLNLVPKRHYKPKWVAPTLRELKKRKDAEIDKNNGEKIFHRSTFLEWCVKLLNIYFDEILNNLY